MQEVKNNGVLTEPTSNDQYAAAYLKNGIMHGITYQVKILTWVTWKLICKSDASMMNWSLGTEVRNARGFHDLVLKYTDNAASSSGGTSNKKRLYRFVQIKHKLRLDEKRKITLGLMKTKQKKNQYSLAYLFQSYLNMINNFEKIMPGEIVDMTIFTNMNIEKIGFLMEVDKDKIFDFEGKGKRYRIDMNKIRDYTGVMNCLEQILPNEVLILDFLSKLTFAVDQPSENKIEELIVREMSKTFSVPQIFYNDLYRNMIQWFLIYDSGKAPYLTEKCVLQYLRNAQNMLLNAKKTEKDILDVSSLSQTLSLLKI